MLYADLCLAGRSPRFLLKYAHRDNAGFGPALMYFRDRGQPLAPGNESSIVEPKAQAETPAQVSRIGDRFAKE